MALGKRVARSRLGRAVLIWLFVRFVRLVFATNRWQTVGREDADAMLGVRASPSSLLSGTGG